MLWFTYIHMLPDLLNIDGVFSLSRILRTIVYITSKYIIYTWYSGIPRYHPSMCTMGIPRYLHEYVYNRDTRLSTRVCVLSGYQGTYTLGIPRYLHEYVYYRDTLVPTRICVLTGYPGNYEYTRGIPGYLHEYVYYRDTRVPTLWGYIYYEDSRVPTRVCILSKFPGTYPSMYSIGIPRYLHSGDTQVPTRACVL